MAEKEKIWDPLRRREVALTPEERVRQWFISVLRDGAGVPQHMMMSEVEMTSGSVGKVYRADILIYDRSARPLAVVECKQPHVPLSRDVLEQALRYDMVLDVKVIMITNCSETRVYRRTASGVSPLDHLPRYDEMLAYD